MKALEQLFSPYPNMIKSRYLEQASNIQKQLNQGIHYSQLRGKRLTLIKDLIRFKFGTYRLIFKRTSTGYIPDSFIPRKEFELFLKRR